ncbi:MAG TPA: hypothetical protein VK912_19420 [Longimicrobiales bacterium]|nr:hypothetical protein [Longimicrobiales bacterium]
MSPSPGVTAHPGGADAVLPLLLLILACGDGPADPGDSLPLMITPAVVTFDGLHQSGGITAARGGRSTSRPDIRVTAEHRWLHDVGVLDADSLAVARLHATGPGKIDLVISAFGGAATMTVQVQPHGPVIMQIVGSDLLEEESEVVLRGYRLDDDLGPITLAGAAATILERDSASVRLLFPDLSSTESCGVSTDTIRVPGAAVLASLARYRAHGTVLTLELGEARTITDEELGCLILPAGTRHALAYYDPTLVERARTQHEAGGSLEWVSFVITPDGATGAPGGFASSEAGHGGDIVRIPEGSAVRNEHAPPHLRSAPWTMGEVFTVSPAPAWEMEAVVHRVYDGGYVLAFQDDLGADTVNGFLQVFDSIMPAFLRETVPFYQEVFSNRAAVTSTASGQLLILVGRSCFAGFAMEAEDVSVARSVGWIVLGVCHVDYGNLPWDYIQDLFNHEMAHVWSFIYAWDQIGERGLGGTIWGLEGVATLMAQEVLRRRMQIGLLSNHDARGENNAYAHSILHPGLLPNGYRNSASFLRDLVVRRMQRGESYESALREVARGGVDGWYGFTACCEEWWHGPGGSAGAGAPGPESLRGRLPGLSARMRDVDPEWEPEDAVLMWTLAHAVDDLTTNPALQVHSFRDAVGTARSMNPAAAWNPDAEVTPAAGPARVSREGGNSGYSYLLSDTRVAVFRIATDEFGTSLRWRIARYQ